MGANDEVEAAIGAALEVITAFYGVRRKDIVSQRRSSLVHKARCMGMYLAKKTGADARAIGRRFGGRDYTIVEAVCRNMARMIADDRGQAALLRDLEVMHTAVIAKRRRPASIP